MIFVLFAFSLSLDTILRAPFIGWPPARNLKKKSWSPNRLSKAECAFTMSHQILLLALLSSLSIVSTSFCKLCQAFIAPKKKHTVDQPKMKPHLHRVGGGENKVHCFIQVFEPIKYTGGGQLASTSLCRSSRGISASLPTSMLCRQKKKRNGTLQDENDSAESDMLPLLSSIRRLR